MLNKIKLLCKRIKSGKAGKGFFGRFFRRAPQIIMTLFVRDEADIVRENIEYHLAAGVDFIVAMDNRSMDGTTDILREYERRRVLRYFFEDSVEYLQDVWVTRLAHVAMNDHNAGWIINNDADEFFIERKGGIRKFLRRIPSDTGAISVERHDFVPVEREGKYSPPVEMIYRKRESLEWVTKKPIRPKVIHRAFPDMVVKRGSHVVVSKSIPAPLPVLDMFTFHYPIRSYNQFESKVRNIGYGWQIRNLNRNSRFTYWYKCWEEGTLEREYLGYQLNHEDVRAGLLSGDLLEEHYLSHYLRKIGDRK